MFNVGLENANKINTTLFVTIMYEVSVVSSVCSSIVNNFQGWSNAKMDVHAIDLLIIADYYRCPNIVAAAIDSLIR